MTLSKETLVRKQVTKVLFSLASLQFQNSSRLVWQLPHVFPLLLAEFNSGRLGRAAERVREAAMIACLPPLLTGSPPLPALSSPLLSRPPPARPEIRRRRESQIISPGRVVVRPARSRSHSRGSHRESVRHVMGAGNTGRAMARPLLVIITVDSPLCPVCVLGPSRGCSLSRPT